ncbi:hypothetical protein HFC70_21660 [Agrobacterium sp. a22-2]|uniref:hypothetical protein n=1 Tax=Agrobacterium sp. a22-2 TaxID=2283840 RepID=UPI001445F1DA|nr:hypothetical protein [Agrobacterium sp. a22-2]NKN38966.1 hypothetical protein [Agrobacterium sp. a22-2]
MQTIAPALLLLAINIGLLWLLMAAPLGRRTISLTRTMRTSPSDLWNAIRPAGAVAAWHPSVTAERMPNPSASRLEQSLRQPDRHGQPIVRTLAVDIEERPEGGLYRINARVVADSSLDMAFWAEFRDHRTVTPAGRDACLTVAQTDHYRGAAFYLYRYLMLYREIGALERFLASGKRASPGWLEHPLVTVLLAVVSTLMLWPFFGLTRNGLMISTMLTVVIILHELGHMTAYRAFGHRSARMIFVPLLGGVAIGGRPYNSLFEVATCALMGPGISAFLVPILIAAEQSVGVSLLPQAVDGPLLVFLLILGAFNLLNLLPMSRFDGGQILRQIFPSRGALAAGSFGITAAILWTGWRIGVPTMALLAALSVFTLMSLMAAVSIKPRDTLIEMTPPERLMAGFGLYAAVSIHAYAVIYACERLLG